MNVADLKWRPESYSDFPDPVALALNGIQGQMRREMVRDMLTAEGEHREVCDGVLGPIQDGLLEASISEDSVQSLNHRLGPSWLGGEYLPRSLPGEVEIARIVLKSVLLDIFSIRARWRSGRYRYRVVDEYENNFDIRRKSSIRPLTLGQLIDLIQTGSQPDYIYNGNGLVEGCWNGELKDGAGPGALEECVRFAHVESDHYPELAAWYEERGRQWRIELVRDRMEECSFCKRNYDPWTDHECEEWEASFKRQQEEHKRREQEWGLHPMANEIQEVMEHWWTVHPGGHRAGGMYHAQTWDRARNVGQLIRDTILTTGAMPSGVYTLEYGSMNPTPKSLTVDFDALADEAKATGRPTPKYLDTYTHQTYYRTVSSPEEKEE